MKTLELQIPDEVVARIESAAQEKGVTIEELIRTSIEESLARDAEFAAAAERVLTKNAELYRRLS